MALITPIAGRYSSTYNAVDTGINEQGFELELDNDFEEINETDAFGTTIIDGIFRGGNCVIDFTSKEYKAGSLTPFWPFGNAVLGVVIDPTNYPIGAKAVTISKSHVLTVVANTPAAAASAINTLTATQALLAKGFQGKLLFNSKVRNVPIRLRYYPFDAGAGLIKFFTIT